jgi:hypothetical protein
MSWGLKMRELLVQQWLLAAVLLCFMPASESRQHDSMQDLVSQSFLFALWWKELACFGVLVSLALLVAVRIALRGTAAKRAAPDEALPEMPNGLKN